MSQVFWGGGAASRVDLHIFCNQPMVQHAKVECLFFATRSCSVKSCWCGTTASDMTRACLFVSGAIVLCASYSNPLFLPPRASPRTFRFPTRAGRADVCLPEEAAVGAGEEAIWRGAVLLSCLAGTRETWNLSRFSVLGAVHVFQEGVSFLLFCLM